MKKHLIYSVLCLALMFSCSTENDSQDLPISNDLDLGKIKAFKSIEDFKSTLALFNTFTGNSDFEEWAEQQDHVPFYNANNVSTEDQDRIPFTFLFLLNENKQFQIGDKLIHYEDGVFYENKIDSSGKLIIENTVFASVETSIISQENTEQSRLANNTTISANGGEYKEWEEFLRNTYRVGCGTPFNKNLRYRLVHYLIVVKTSGPLFTQSDLIFKLRMSQKTSSGWHYNNTSTERLYDLNLSGTWKMKFFTGETVASQGINIDDQNSCGNPLKGTKSYWIGNYNFVTGTNLSNYNWVINLHGTVFHKVNGDTNEIDTYISW